MGWGGKKFAGGLRFADEDFGAEGSGGEIIFLIFK